MKHYRIDTIIDVGANVGQYGHELRSLGFRGRIVSFEPLPSAFERLARRVASDRNWQALQLAIGDRVGEATLHVAANSVSSSFLEILPTHVEAAPASRYVDRVSVAMSTLDEALDTYVSPVQRVFVKVDAQGYESRVLAGAARVLPRITGWQLELSIVPLYKGSAGLTRLVDELARCGYTLMSVEPGFTDPRTGRLLQLDGLFFRTEPTVAIDEPYAPTAAGRSWER